MNNVTDYNNQTITRGDLKYQGKAKSVYWTSQADILWLHDTNQATALNGKVHENISDKGRLNSAISYLLFKHLHQHGVATHYLKHISETDELVEKLDIIPVEVVVRNFASGHFVSRFGVASMTELTPIVQEFYYKSDALDDPFINDSQLIALHYATAEEIKSLRLKSAEINDILRRRFAEINIELIDFKLEFGRRTDGNMILADELSPDNMRLVDKTSGQSLDKDIFRQHKGDLTVGYREVLQRLEKLEK